MIAYRAWGGIRALEPGTIAVVSSHSALLRGFAAAAIGHDPGEPANLEHVEVVTRADRATVTFRDHVVDVDVPRVVPPWIDPDYLAGGRGGDPSGDDCASIGVREVSEGGPGRCR